jgi:hypothetical protein
VRPTGDSHRRALSPADKPRDAEAMDMGVARSLDPQLAKRQAEAGTKPKSSAQSAVDPEQPERRRRV